MLTFLLSKLGFIPKKELLCLQGFHDELRTRYDNIRELNVELKADQVTAIRKFQEQEKIAEQTKHQLKIQTKKNSRLLTKQKNLKEQIVNLQAELHNSTVQKEFVKSRVKILSEDLSLLRSELEGLGIKEPEDITKLQARVRELEKTLDLKVKYQMLLDAMLNARMYGFDFAYIGSLKPRSVEVLSAKFKKD
jgi:hypothetical protein